MCNRCAGAAQFRRAVRPVEELIAKKNVEIEALRHEIDCIIVLLSEHGYDVDMTKYGDTALYSAIQDLLDDRWRKDDQQ